jgi:hypothetical protein
MVSGNSTETQDNSAIFLGVLSDTFDIAWLTFSISDSALPDFAVNQLDLVAVPFPGVGPLFLAGLVLLGWTRRR